MTPETQIKDEIKIIINKLSITDYRKINKYILELLNDRYAYWEDSMGEDL